MRVALCSTHSDSSQPLPFLLLPSLCCEAAGGKPERTVGAAAAWVLLYTAAHLLDDVEDGDITDDSAPTINVATGLIFTALQTLTDLRRSEIADQTVLQVIDEFTEVVLKMCGSQHADLVEVNPSLERCWKIGEAKSGAWFALGCRTGAILADTTDELIECYSQFGYHLGMLVQISDDLRGIWALDGKRSDLAARKWTLPVAYTWEVTPPATRERLLGWLAKAPRDPAAEAGARGLIEECGAPLYLTVEAERHHRRAEATLRAATPVESVRDQLTDLLNRIKPSRQWR